jgi:hypothetical protein
MPEVIKEDCPWSPQKEPALPQLDDCLSLSVILDFSFGSFRVNLQGFLDVA